MIITYKPIFKLLHKNQVVEWNEDCQATFDKIKQYLQEPPMSASSWNTAYFVCDSVR